MKLEDIDKDNIFKVPDSYFDKLPGRIQSKVQSGNQKFLLEVPWLTVLKISVSMAAILFFIFYFGPFKTQGNLPNPENLLAQVKTDDVIAYLELTDLSIDDLIEQSDLTDADLWQDEEDPLIDDLDLDENQLLNLIDPYKTGKEYLYN